jgi:hypothetical protein
VGRVRSPPAWATDGLSCGAGPEPAFERRPAVAADREDVRPRPEVGRPPALPTSTVFEVPDDARTYRLRVQDRPPVLVRVPETDEEDEGAD